MTAFEQTRTGTPIDLALQRIEVEMAEWASLGLDYISATTVLNMFQYQINASRVAPHGFPKPARDVYFDAMARVANASTQYNGDFLLSGLQRTISDSRKLVAQTIA
jgi:hypothetical protein